MKLDPGFSDELIELVKDVSDRLPEEAEELLREDTESLKVYLASEAFLDDLHSGQLPIAVGTDVFFLVLLFQLQRKINEDERFQRDFLHQLRSTSDKSWSKSSVKSFLDDQHLIFYLVKMLDRFVDAEELYNLPNRDDDDYRYVFEMIEASRESNDSERYQIFCHIGNYSLYLTGVFPDYIRYRHERKNRPMDVNSYCNYGKTYYEKAAKHRLARKQSLEPVLKKLSRGYDLVRTSLELMFKRLVPASG